MQNGKKYIPVMPLKVNKKKVRTKYVQLLFFTATLWLTINIISSRSAGRIKNWIPDYDTHQMLGI